jgi:peptidoglycan/LPS O-acetylase OafA/YrhL
MLSEYEAAMLAKQKATGGEPALGCTSPARNRMRTVLLVLSVLSAAGLLCAVFSDRGHVARATQAAPAPTAAIPVIHPATTGLPEAALFLRHPPLASGDRAAELMNEWRLR